MEIAKQSFILPVAYHESALCQDARMSLLDNVEHELAGLAEHHRLPARRCGDGRHHRARACINGLGSQLRRGKDECVGKLYCLLFLLFFLLGIQTHSVVSPASPITVVSADLG